MFPIFLSSFFLSIFGIFTVLGVKSSLLLVQFSHFIIAVAVFFIMKKIGKNFFQVNSKLFYWLFVFILLITFFIGLEVKGSKRWIDFYLFRFQASEFFKSFFILFFANYFARRPVGETKLFYFLKSIIFLIIPVVIIFKQPDLGNALVYSFIFLMMIIFSKVPKKYLFTGLIFSIIIAPIGFMILKDYQKDRLISFINPQIDTQGTAYNMIQSIITVGSGKFWGRGLGYGTQSRLAFLPENHTDFAYSSLVEQFGFIGGIVVILLFSFLVFSLINRAIKYYFQKDDESRINFLYLVGFISYLIFHIFINVGMNLGIFPITGITLPFISYGGSSTMAILIGFALMP